MDKRRWGCSVITIDDLKRIREMLVVPDTDNENELFGMLCHAQTDALLEVDRLIAEQASVSPTPDAKAAQELRELREKLQVEFEKMDYCVVCDNHLSSGHSKNCLARITP